MSINIRAFVLTVSDTRRTGDDESGNKLVELLTSEAAEVVGRDVVTDELSKISDLLLSLADRQDINLILTTGGTGFGPRDNTPEATLAVIEREAPGIAEAMRRETSSKTPMAMLSRGVAGIRGHVLIINLPGSPKSAAECFDVIRPVLKHAVDLVGGKGAHAPE